MITNVIIHLVNDMPILVDIEQLPSGADRTIHCTNVRTLDGKRPAFVHDKKSTFVFPLSVIRLIEAPAEGSEASKARSSYEPEVAPLPPPSPDEEPDEDLLARIRSV